MIGIGELGSSSDESDCSGFHNCCFGASSIATKRGQKMGHHHRWSNNILNKSNSEATLKKSSTILPAGESSLPVIPAMNSQQPAIEKARMGAEIFSA